MSDRNPERIFLYVPHAWREKAVQLGWEITDALIGTHHGNYSILMEWKKGGKPVMPFKSREKRYERR